jgi:hypothetical protein
MSKKTSMNSKSASRIQRASANKFAGFVPKGGFSSRGQSTPARNNTGRKK